MMSLPSSTPYDGKPWLARYRAGQPHAIAPAFTDALSVFRAAVARAGERPAILYFDGSLSYAELDAQSDALACARLARGCARGDRIAIYLQNVPQFVIATVAAWKIGAIAVPVNPMNRARELRLLLADSGARLLVCHESLYAEVVHPLLAQEAGLAGLAARGQPALQPAVMTTSELEYQSRLDPRLFAGGRRVPAEALAGAEDGRGHRGPSRQPSAAGLARAVRHRHAGSHLGHHRGAQGRDEYPRQHRLQCRVYRDWIALQEGPHSRRGAAVPYHRAGRAYRRGFHLRGAAGAGLPLRAGRDPDAIREHRVAFTIGSITVFIALMNHPQATREHFATLTRIYSGGAPIPPSVVEAFRARFGHYIHNGYGLTETNSPTHVVPFGSEAPVDPASGALAVGVPAFNVESYIGDDEGRPLPVGEVGEIISRGPMIVPGYWNKPQESAKAIVDGYFRTGDVGFMDERGWFYGRPQEGHDQRRRLQGLAARGGGRAVHPPGGARGGRGRGAGRLPGRNRQGRGQPETAGAGDSGRAGGLLQGAHGGLQVPAHRRHPRRTAEDGDRQDPAASCGLASRTAGARTGSAGAPERRLPARWQRGRRRALPASCARGSASCARSARAVGRVAQRCRSGEIRYRMSIAVCC